MRKTDGDRDGFEGYLRTLFEREWAAESITSIREVAPRAARYGEWHGNLRPELIEAYRAHGIEDPYIHQSGVWEHVFEGRDVVVVTPTASGKTLCYNVPILQTILDDPAARALYLFPTKALSQDQVNELQEVIDHLGADIRTFTYDGDTPSDARQAIRAQGHLVVTNPDMLHQGILPHHTRWQKLFENLRYVVIDELHTYRGVFGSHLANLLRRLQRICRFYGSNPVFICSSATIANPKELAETLLEREVELVEENGAPQAQKYFVLYNPPVINEQLGIRAGALSHARKWARLFLREDVQTIVFAGSRLHVEILTKYLKDTFDRRPAGEGLIRGYRGGYLPLMRREIEAGLRDGSIRGVVSTNALELGIDIGDLQACVMAGYPGSIASAWQQAGRAGRRAGTSVAIMVASSRPLDQFMVTHPEYFFGSSPEHGRINPDNLLILVSHIKCAAFELPFEEGESFGGEPLEEILDYLVEQKVLNKAGTRWHWMVDAYPADGVSLRSAAPENFVVIDRSDGTRVLAEVDFDSAPETLHEGAVYMVQSEQYQVEQLDYDNRKAFVRRVDTDYFTDAISYTRVRILDVFDSTAADARTTGTPLVDIEDREVIDEERPLEGVGVRANESLNVRGTAGTDLPGESAGAIEEGTLYIAEYGEVHVLTHVSGFKKIKFYTSENVGYGDVNLPDHEMHTTSFWLTVPETVLEPLQRSRAEIVDGMFGIAYALQGVAALFMMCDIRDMGRSVGDKSATWYASLGRGSRGVRYSTGAGGEERDIDLEGIETFQPTIFLYDNYPGGIGFSSSLFDLSAELLRGTLDLIRNCACEEGCPSCVGPVGEVSSQGRAVATEILELVLGSGDQPGGEQLDSILEAAP
ncbi:DEAD/DEAH box helicase [Gemmatimonadota bacterium]